MIDRVGPVVVGAGISGHGVTFTPTVGRLPMGLVDGVHTAPELVPVARPTSPAN